MKIKYLLLLSVSALVLSILSLGLSIYVLAGNQERINKQVASYVQSHKTELKGDKGEQGVKGPQANDRRSPLPPQTGHGDFPHPAFARVSLFQKAFTTL